jgi:predicted lipoprotein
MPLPVPLSLEETAKKSVAVQGFPALERLLYARTATRALSTPDSPECRVASVIAQTIDAMASALNAGWRSDSPLVQNLLHPQAHSAGFRSNEEVLRSFVTQILVGVEIVLDRKIAPLPGDGVELRQAPMWRSGQTFNMIEANLAGLRALTVDSGLAEATRLGSQLAFEFRTADGLVQCPQALPKLNDDRRSLNDEAASLVQSLQAVLNGIVSR